MCLLGRRLVAQRTALLFRAMTRWPISRRKRPSEAPLHIVTNGLGQHSLSPQRTIGISSPRSPQNTPPNMEGTVPYRSPMGKPREAVVRPGQSISRNCTSLATRNPVGRKTWQAIFSGQIANGRSSRHDSRPSKYSIGGQAETSSCYPGRLSTCSRRGR